MVDVSPPGPGPVALVARLRALPDRRDELTAVIEAEWEQEPGMQVVVMHEALDDADALVFYERYESWEAARAHGERERANGSRRRIEDLLAEPMRIDLLVPRCSLGRD